MRKRRRRKNLLKKLLLVIKPSLWIAMTGFGSFLALSLYLSVPAYAERTHEINESIEGPSPTTEAVAAPNTFDERTVMNEEQALNAVAQETRKATLDLPNSLHELLSFLEPSNFHVESADYTMDGYTGRWYFFSYKGRKFFATAFATRQESFMEDHANSEIKGTMVLTLAFDKSGKIKDAFGKRVEIKISKLAGGKPFSIEKASWIPAKSDAAPGWTWVHIV